MSFSSLYVGATGVIAHGDRMQVVANNLANVSTVGYKKADALFGDLMSRQENTTAVEYENGSTMSSQIGLGVGLSEIRNIFKEGGLENTETVTDLAITGNGFFGVRDTSQNGSSGATHYTRAGSFRFNNEAYLVDPHDFRLQGYAVDRETGEIATSVSDIQLPYEDVIIDGQEVRVVQSDPRATTGVEMISTLDALASDDFSSTNNPFFAMLEAYDGTSTDATPFGPNGPAYSSGIDVYDEDGNARTMTVYFDPVDNSSISNASSGYSYWEYLVAMPPESDGSSAYGTSAAGLAGLGVMTFDGNGQFVDQTAFSLNGTGDGKTLSSWGVASFDDDGYPVANFTFGSNGSAVGDMSTIGINFGLSSTSGAFEPGASNAGAVGINTAALGGLEDVDRGQRSTNSFNTGSATLFQNQDGYTSGYLQNTSVSREGFLEGRFTNGETEQFYQISMYTFTSNWGLRRDGGNNFLATEASGAAMAGTSETGGRGTMQQNTLESSNVDMAEEFANMIITQRGYQANTKIITTSDSLLNTTISVKR